MQKRAVAQLKGLVAAINSTIIMLLLMNDYAGASQLLHRLHHTHLWNSSSSSFSTSHTGKHDPYLSQAVTEIVVFTKTIKLINSCAGMLAVEPIAAANLQFTSPDAIKILKNICC